MINVEYDNNIMIYNGWCTRSSRVNKAGSLSEGRPIAGTRRLRKIKGERKSGKRKGEERKRERKRKPF